jgi:hypothetical protein
MAEPLTLSKALKTGRLRQFIKEQEAAGVPSADAALFDKALTATVKPPRSKRQTSRSPSRDGSAGK